MNQFCQSHLGLPVVEDVSQDSQDADSWKDVSVQGCIQPKDLQKSISSQFNWIKQKELRLIDQESRSEGVNDERDFILEDSSNSRGLVTVKSVAEVELNPKLLKNNFDEQPIIEGGDGESEDDDSLFNNNQEDQQENEQAPDANVENDAPDG